MHALPLHLGPGSDLRHSLEQLALEQQASGFVLGVVGNLSQAAFQCPGQSEPSLLRGDLEIITLNGTFSPQGVHLHLSLSDGSCQVWGGHLEHGTLVLKGADLLVGVLTQQAGEEPPAAPLEPLVEIAVLPGCPFSARALRLLHTLGIPHQVQEVASEAERQELDRRTGQWSLPQVFIDGQPIGGYGTLADLHARGQLEALRR
jgi:predicted DNA-binding protein with PD1-like motif/glutaredoxin